MEKLGKDELVKGSIILFIMMIMYSLFNYAFQISMARILGPADYGVLAVLMSLIYIFGIPSEAIQTIVSKYTSKFNVRGEFGKMKDFMLRAMKKGALFAIVIFIIFLLIAFFLSNFLKIEFWLFGITGLYIFYVFTVSITRGIIQGRKKFLGLGINLVVESSIKFLAAVLLVTISWRVYGAITGVLMGCLIAFTASFLTIKEVLASKRKKEKFKGIYLSSLPILISVVVVVLMYSLDILIARRVFPPELAGQYAFVSMIGKVILFLSMSIGKAMFPISSEKFESGKKTSYLFKKSMVFVAIIAGLLLFFYLLFPQQVVRLISLGSSEYLSASNILFIVGLAYSFVAFANVIIMYGLSINKIKRLSFSLLFFVLLQVILLSIFNSSLFEFSIALLSVAIIMFLYSLWLVKK